MGNDTIANNSNDGKCKCDYELEKYKITLEFLKFEGTTLWQIFSAFLIAHTILIGFIATLFTDNKCQDINFVLLLISGVVGLLLAILWLGTCIRNSAWYNFRMVQAKIAEREFTKCNDTHNWSLLTKDGEDFAKGNQVKLIEEKFQMPCLGRFITNKFACYGMPMIFILIYLGIILYSSQN